jgi:hypothetical protein
MTENQWRKEYEAALLEVDLKKLGPRVTAAENAINARVASLNGDCPMDERVAIEEALSNLRLLKRIREE